MPIKSSMTKPDKKKRVKVNRGVPPLVVILEEIAEEVIEDVKEAVLDVVLEVVEEVEQVVEDFVENIVLSNQERLAEECSVCPPADEEYDHPDCPVSPCAFSKKRVRKVVEPKPLVNEKGEYLNPRTNRYVKSGTSAYKQLVKDGVILESICV
jgi:hypothetical protein